jgi:hypothetical protein
VRAYRVAAAFAVSVALAPAASFGAQRTFVASTGVDTAPCSLQQPCRSFAAAIAKVNDGGDVVVLDSAGYGKVTVTKSVSITAPPGIYAGITLQSNEQGVTIDAPGAVVVLRGLSITAIGSITEGVHLTQAADVRIEGLRIIGTGNAIYADLSGGASITIVDTSLSNTFLGVWLHGAGHAALDNVDVTDAGTSVFVDDMSDALLHAVRSDAIRSVTIGSQTAATAAVVSGSRFAGDCGGVELSTSAPVAAVVVRDSQIAGVTGNCGSGALNASASGGGVARMTLVGSRISASFPALFVSGANASAYLDADTFVANPGSGTAINANGGQIYTRVNNTLQGTTVGVTLTPYVAR